MEGMKIGKLKLKNRLFLAPMVDVTDLPFRLLCRRCGVGMAYTEMLYIDAILHKNAKTESLMKTCKEDSPLGLQITGNNEEEFEKFVKSGKWKKFDLIDLNCGCPSVRITGSEAGSYLLNNPEKIGNMIRILKKTGKPVTAKIRLGFKKNNVLRVVREIESAGADALTLHARLAVHGRDVPADWKWFKKVRSAIKIPLIGNGDVFSGADVEKVLKVCDGVMVARGAIGNPLIFSEILDYFSEKKGLVNKSLSELNGVSDSSGDVGEFNVAGNLKMFAEYLKLQKKFFGAMVDLGRVKYVGGKFLRGFEGAGEARQKLMGCKSLGEIEEAVGKIIK